MLLSGFGRAGVECRQIDYAVADGRARQMLWRGLGYAHPVGAHRADSRAILSRGRSDDAREGVTSFLEKRAASSLHRVSAATSDFFPWWEEPRYS